MIVANVEAVAEVEAAGELLLIDVTGKKVIFLGQLEVDPSGGLFVVNRAWHEAGNRTELNRRAARRRGRYSTIVGKTRARVDLVRYQHVLYVCEGRITRRDHIGPNGGLNQSDRAGRKSGLQLRDSSRRGHKAGCRGTWEPRKALAIYIGGTEKPNLIPLDRPSNDAAKAVFHEPGDRSRSAAGRRGHSRWTKPKHRTLLLVGQRIEC